MLKKEIPIHRSVEITYVICNFIGNAVKYSKSKIDIILKIENSKQVKITISDDGPGFPRYF